MSLTLNVNCVKERGSKTHDVNYCPPHRPRKREGVYSKEEEEGVDYLTSKTGDVPISNPFVTFQE